MIYLKYLIFGALIAVCFCKPKIPEDMQEMVDMLHDSCTAETGATNAQIEDANNGKFADDNNFKCYMKCIYVQMAIMEDDGSFDAEAALAVMPEDVKSDLEKVIDKCKSEVGTDPCDTAFLINKCFYGIKPELYLLI